VHAPPLYAGTVRRQLATHAGISLVLALLFASCGSDSAPQIEVPSWAKVAPEQIAEAWKHGVPVAFENDLGMRFVLIPAGTFLMGSPEDEVGREDNETQHEVTISRPYYISIYEVTNGQYLRYQPSYVTGYSLEEVRYNARCPVEIRWRDVPAFMDWMNARGGSRAYRIPKEEEWEYACRAGSSTRFWWGESKSVAGRYANVWNQRDFPGWDELARPLPGWGPFDSDDGHRMDAPVGSFEPNPWGLYDVAGNVREWCRAISERDATERDGESEPSSRGGEFMDNWGWVRSAFRGLGPWDPDRPPSFGLRLVSPLTEADE